VCNEKSRSFDVEKTTVGKGGKGGKTLTQ